MKKIVPALVFLVLIGVGGYLFMNSKNSPPKAPIGSSSNNSDSNVFTSIKDALSKSLSLKCVYRDEKGIETTTYIKGGAIRVMMTTSANDKEQPNNIVLKNLSAQAGKKMYMWNETTKTGFTLTMTDPAVTPGQAVETKKNQDAEVLAEIEKYKDSCKAEVISDSFFTVPTDVKFQDMSAFTEGLMKQASPVTNSDTEQSTNDAQKALEEMMKQITPEAGDGQ